MRNLTVAEYGRAIGCEGDRLQVKEKGELVVETPFSRLRTIIIAKRGVTVSSDVMLRCAHRGIRLFVLDWRNITVAALVGRNQHAVAALRAQQFDFLKTNKVRDLSANIVVAKIRNQRAVLLYYTKYLKQKYPEQAAPLVVAADQLAQAVTQIEARKWANYDQWRDQLMGYEGSAAARYFAALRDSRLLPPSFEKRTGRGATEIVNQLLNYGYAMLSSQVLAALDNAGLELYAGAFHQERAGRPSLVLDMMEELRPWVVDRTIINMRQLASQHNELNDKLKRRLSQDILETMGKRYPYKGKKVRLDSLLQRQIYRLARTFIDPTQQYRGYRFRW